MRNGFRGWYAVGYCHHHLAILVFAVQQVRSVKETGATFERPANFRLDGYLEGSFRVLRGEGGHTVVLRVSPELAGRIRKRSWHPSESERTEPDGSSIARFRVNDLREIKRWAVGWCADCRVIEPKELP